MSIRILTDSAADFERQELAKKNIYGVPLEVRFGSETFLDGLDLDKAGFYQRLTENREAPATSQPSPEAFLREFEAAREAGEPVVAVLISSTLSGTYQSACLARELCGWDEIHIVDSRSASGAERLLVDMACDMAAKGCSAFEIAAELTKRREKLRIFAAVDTLEYLCRGGRLSKTEAQLGSLAHIKPILTLAADGVIRSRDKSMGLSRARARLLKLLEQTPCDTRFPLYPLYSHTDGNCQKLCQELQEQFPDIRLAEPVGMGPSIGAHVGPGLLGFAYLEA